MKITLTKEESIKFFHNALCNGLSYMGGYGLELNYNSKQYATSRKKLTDPCIEDVWIQMLHDGYKLTMLDIEGNGDNTQSIGLKEVIARVKNTPIHHLVDMVNGDDDADTADAIIQTVFFNELVFG
jgi:hypothetical protein